MKKIFLIFVILLLNLNMALASNCLYNCVEPYGLSSGFFRFVSGLGGSNFIAENIAKSILRGEIEKNVQGNVRVRLNSYSTKDLQKGIFKSIRIKGKNINIDGIKFSRLNIKTLCDFNYVSQDVNNNIVFNEDLPLSFSVQMTEDDINSAVLIDDYQKLIQKINERGRGFFIIENSKLKIKENKLYFILQVSLPFVKDAQDVVIASDLKVNDGRIKLANIRLANRKLAVNIKKVDRIVNYLNPLDFSLDILQNKNAVLTVQNVEIKDDKIYVDGIIVIPKD